MGPDQPSLQEVGDPIMQELGQAVQTWKRERVDATLINRYKEGEVAAAVLMAAQAVTAHTAYHAGVRPSDLQDSEVRRWGARATMFTALTLIMKGEACAMRLPPAWEEPPLLRPRARSQPWLISHNGHGAAATTK